MKRIVLIVGILALAVSGLSLTQVASAEARDVAFPKIIALPNGFQPEGIVIGRGANLYAGSLANGAIYRASLLTGQGDILVPPHEGRIAVGLSYDRRSDLIFVAGGPGGSAYVYDAKTGADVTSYALTAAGSFVNDVIVTRSAAYFTDSFRPVFYRLPLGVHGQLPDPTQVQEIPLSGDFVFMPGNFNANGIEASADGKTLLIVNTARGELYRVDPATGSATLIDLNGGSVPSGDGLLRIGHKLYVVQNFLNQIAVVHLDRDFASGEIVKTLTDPAFRVPTTIDRFGPFLYAVNARFDTTPTPDTDYDVVQLLRH